VIGVVFGHHMGEETLAAALAGGTAVVPVTFLVVRAKIDRIVGKLRRGRPT
jgi:hypothetical protein